MDEKIRNTILIIVSVIVLFLVLSISPNKGSQLQGNLIVQQPAALQQEAITEGIFLSSDTGILKSKVDLTNWKSVEVAIAIAKNNPRLDPKPYNYRYKDDCTFYSQYGDLFGKDPFCNLVFPTQGPQGEEWNDGHLRIQHFDYDIKEPAEQKYKEYVEDVLKETQIDTSLTCFTQKECNNINVIVCTKDNHNYFSWFEGHILMTSVDDARRNLNAFTRFYCSSELKPLTGGIVSSLPSGTYIIDSIAEFIKRLS